MYEFDESENVAICQAKMEFNYFFLNNLMDKWKPEIYLRTKQIFWMIFYQTQWCRNRGGQGGHWPPQYFADQLTLFEPGRADYPHLLLLAPSMFFTFRHH